MPKLDEITRDWPDELRAAVYAALALDILIAKGLVTEAEIVASVEKIAPRVEGAVAEWERLDAEWERLDDILHRMKVR
jgi:hypothetical protein